MMILHNLMQPWMATVIDIELADPVEQTAQVTIASLCGSRLIDTTVMPIALFPIRYQGDPVWQQHLEAISNPEGSSLPRSMAVMAEYAQLKCEMIFSVVVQFLLQTRTGC
jgi:hypothetical protein